MEIHNLKVNSYHWKSNDTWKINATILNNGFGNISSWNNSVHLSKDRATYEFPFSEGGNIKMNYNINVPLNANESYEYSTSGSIPISYEGYYYLASCVTWDFPRKSHCEVLDNPVFIGDEVPEVASIEKILENKIEIYPNPTKDFINIKTEIQVTSISIYSGDGRLIMKTLNRKQIDVSNLKSGLYILVIQSESGVLSKKIVLD
ncbi:MAG: T9SS type A sorting domain-containing protein [Sporocytophaga sp.]|nr:T9SS type A sorting domain-containing protein [Sporocytophaga sp.]